MNSLSAELPKKTSPNKSGQFNKAKTKNAKANIKSKSASKTKRGERIALDVQNEQKLIKQMNGNSLQNQLDILTEVWITRLSGDRNRAMASIQGVLCNDENISMLIFLLSKKYGRTPREIVTKALEEAAIAFDDPIPA